VPAKNSPPKEDDKEMLRQVQKYLNPSSHSEAITGFTHANELGLFYLKEKRLDEADRLFIDLAKKDRVVPYRWLGRLGHAIALAFKDEPAASNQDFLAVIADVERIESRTIPKKKEWSALKDEMEAYRLVWRENLPLREWAAKALDRNHVNAPVDFPEKLSRHRLPPLPVLKTAP
jgi:hypothetical protein